MHIFINLRCEDVLRLRGEADTGIGEPRVRYSVYLLYWSKSTKTDAAGGASHASGKFVSRGVSWTSPYVDASGLGLVLTVSAPVYDATGSILIGVVGVDATLAELAVLLREARWGEVYTEREGGS